MQKINIRKFYYHLRHRYFTLNNVVVAVAFFIAVSWAWGSVGMMERNYKLQKEVDTKQREQQLLELENQTLAFQQRYYQSDEYKDLAARERLGLVTPGERVLILPPNSAEASSVDESADRQQPVSVRVPSNFEQWTNFLFGGNSQSLK